MATTSVTRAAPRTGGLGQRVRSVPRTDAQRVRTEWVIQRIRYGAVVIGVLIAVLVTDPTRRGLWLAPVVLALSVVSTELVLRRDATHRQLTIIGATGFILDGIATLYTLALISTDPADPVTLVALILALEAALRWQLIGGLLGGAGAAMVTAVWTEVAHQTATGTGAPVEYLAFRVTATILVATMVGAMVRALEAARHRAQTVLALSPELIVTVAATGHLVAANPASRGVLGWASEELVGCTWAELLAPGQDPDLPSTTHGLLTRAFSHADGEVVWLECSVRHEAHSELTVVIARDITERLASERAREASEQRFRALFERHLDAVLGLELTGVITDANPAGEVLLGGPVDTLVGRELRTLVAEGSEPDLANALAAARRGEAVDVEVVLQPRPDSHGTQRHVELTLVPIVLDDTPVGAFALVSDVTDRTRREAELAYRAGHDPLTGLANRATLLTQLGERLAGQEPIALLFVDLDGFKAVNDTHGHAAGDAVLVATAHRLRSVVRGEDLVARLAGDEFCLVLAPSDELSARRIAERATEAASEPVLIPGVTLQVGASVGVALSRAGDTDVTLLARADEAMYAAKTRRHRQRIERGSEDDRRG